MTHYLAKKYILLFIKKKRISFRAAWKVTKIYIQCTFDQKAFKNDYILTNQKQRQRSPNKV